LCPARCYTQGDARSPGSPTRSEIASCLVKADRTHNDGK
jgi:hypothetical protein